MSCERKPEANVHKAPAAPTDNTNCETVTAAGSLMYTVFFSGSGGKDVNTSGTDLVLIILSVTTSPATSSANDGGATYPVYTNNLAGTLSSCDAISQCATLAYNDPPSSPINYYSFDVHYQISPPAWVCIQYYDLGQTSDFSVQNANVGQAYGYDATAYV